MDLNEARKNLEACLGEDLRKEYFDILRQWFSFKSPITRKEFDTEVRKLLVNEEQIRCHNYFVLALLSKRTSSKVKSTRNSCDKGVFECAEYSDYIQPSSPTMLPPAEYESRSAAAELFMPDSGFVSTRIAVTSWENGLDGADDNVTEVIVHACQVFVRNIITAMISRLKGYRIREGKFQYGFNLPVPDPFIRNYHNVIDETQESKIEVVDHDDTFIPRSKPSLENVEQQAAFMYSCAKRKRSDNVLTVKLLYETLKENPHILGLHELHSVNVFKLGLQIED
ncbi:SAGA-Tad1 domain containing protein [Asbolus verrucosus]|uniref:SAGA-Tad1 domain containing protein n=1 Tax=Asbolus verrucosus TaxID=1661398 RepID=A0A482W591_ASBVE|nr:SAGA-Tad1 domain containing protein [Asbolus verrucosus]